LRLSAEIARGYSGIANDEAAKKYRAKAKALVIE
jgi:hypothetical protein